MPYGITYDPYASSYQQTMQRVQNRPVAPTPQPTSSYQQNVNATQPFFNPNSTGVQPYDQNRAMEAWGGRYAAQGADYASRQQPPAPTQVGPTSFMNPNIFGGGNYGWTPQGMQPFTINIPQIDIPKPPPVTQLTYDQLLALIQADPTFLADKAANAEDLANAESTYTSQRELLVGPTGEGGRQAEDVRRLGLQENEAYRLLSGQLATTGTGESGAAAFMRGRTTSSFNQQESDIRNQYADQLSKLETQIATARTQSERNAAIAQQNAINRYLNSRVNPTEVIY